MLLKARNLTSNIRLASQPQKMPQDFLTILNTISTKLCGYTASLVLDNLAKIFWLEFYLYIYTTTIWLHCQPPKSMLTI